MPIGYGGDEAEHEVPLPLIELLYGFGLSDVPYGSFDFFLGHFLSFSSC